MANLSKLESSPVVKKFAVIGSIAAIAAFMYKARSSPSAISSSSGSRSSSSSSSSSPAQKTERVSVNSVFFKRLWTLLKIVCPGLLTPETFFMFLVSFSLVSRTTADLWIIQVSTNIESAIIGRDQAGFLRYLLEFFLGMVPVAFINSLLRYSLSELTLRFRSRLTHYLYHLYMKGFVYYRLGNLDNRIPNADQLLTTDVEKFCASITELFSNISKPLLDIIIYSRRLSGAIGVEGPVMMLGYLVGSGLLLTRLRRPLARFTMEEQRLEGEFRNVNSRLITHSEEIAFYGGNAREKDTIAVSFSRLVSHLRRAMNFRFLMSITDSIITKYFATVVGFLIMSRGLMYQRPGTTVTAASATAKADAVADYYRNGRMLMGLAGAIGRLVLAGREMTRLAGFTARVTELVTVIKELDVGDYKRSMVTDSSSSQANHMPFSSEFGPNKGKIISKDYIIKFENVPLVTPNGDVLIKALNFEVKSGDNVLIVGPNGCGKSSLFRTLGGLWPIFGGVMTKPDGEKLFYVPQRPYMTLGTLRDQILYPYSLSVARDNGITDAMLDEALSLVQLSHLVEREGGWDAVADWMDKLSGGEKQRVAMARLFIHKPQFAILDECTSAVSVDAEGAMYTHCKQIGITLFTVSHRKSLWKYHEHVLRFDGRGAYEFEAIDEKNTYGS